MKSYNQERFNAYVWTHQDGAKIRIYFSPAPKKATWIIALTPSNKQKMMDAITVVLTGSL